MELITAVALFAIFSLVVLVGINPLAQYQKALDSRRKNDLAQLARAIEMYYADHSVYPVQSNLLIVDDDTGQPIPWGNEWQPYIDLLPKDPSGTKRYTYYTTTDRQTFRLHASLDRKTDPANCDPIADAQGLFDACPNAQGECSSTGSQYEGSHCTYGVTSPNTTP